MEGRKKQHVRCGKILRNEGEVITRRLEATAGARIAPETWQIMGKQHVMATKCLSGTSQDRDRKVKGFSENIVIVGSLKGKSEEEMRHVVGTWCISTTTVQRTVKRAVPRCFAMALSCLIGPSTNSHGQHGHCAWLVAK